MQFKISFLNQAYPKFASRWVSTDKFTPWIDRQIIIDDDASPSSIHEELDYVLTCRVVNWLPTRILWIDVPRNKFALTFVFELEVSCNSQTTQHRAVPYLSLRHFVAINIRGNVWHPIHELLSRNHVDGALPHFKFGHLFNTQRQKSVRVLILFVFKYTKTIRNTFETYFTIPDAGVQISTYFPLTVALFSIMSYSTGSNCARNTFFASYSALSPIF